MEALISLKRKNPVSLSECILCQEKKEQPLFSATVQGLSTISQATQERHKLRDQTYKCTIERLLQLLNQPSEKQLVWHKHCYASYTSKDRIERIRRAPVSAPSPSCSTASALPNLKEENSPRTLVRTKRLPCDWNMCMFCQTNVPKQRLNSVTTFNVSEQILNACKFDQKMAHRVAGVHDLIAAEGKYHLSCYVKFTRNTNKIKEDSKRENIDLPMLWLCDELKHSATQGRILELSVVWKRYCQLCEKAGSEIPKSYQSRLATFKTKLESRMIMIYQFIFLPEGAMRKTLLVPLKFNHLLLMKEAENNSDVPIPSYKPVEEDEFLSLVHVALKLRADVLSHPPYKGVDVHENAAIDCVPESLYIFLNLMLGGQEIILDSSLAEDEDDDDCEQNDAKENCKQSRILSIAQDLVYTVSHGRQNTPKHLGLGSTLHQITRSKDLVQLFHKAGHTASYRDILRLDTALAESTLKSMDTLGSVLPPNLVKGRFVHFTADNIDINEANLDGQNSFHATQLAAWQRGPPKDSHLRDIELSDKDTLIVPEEMSLLLSPNIEGASTPKFSKEIRSDWFNKEDCPSSLLAKAKDMAFVMIREQEIPKSTWTNFNKDHSDSDPERTTVGYLPIIQAPAHDLDTLNTVVQRILHISKQLEQKHVVLTVDQALFPKLMELKWSVAEYRDVLIPRLGGLHISMNFLKVIGQHMSDCGLTEVWEESKLLGPNVADQVMAGKAYARATRAHKLTYQALWQLLLPKLLAYIDCSDNESNFVLKIPSSDDPTEFAILLENLSSKRFSEVISSFIQTIVEKNHTSQFWWNYIEMVGILLQFIRAQRDGLWELHKFAFSRMLPFFFRYDHTNYARWGSIYLAEMEQIPEPVLAEFLDGNFVVKETKGRFNQVDPDHSQEWLNATGKKGGGIVGITKTPSALNRWALSYNLRAQIAAQTRELLHCPHQDEYIHNESTFSRKKRDELDEGKLVDTFRRFELFSSNTATSSLQNVANKDLATTEIAQSLLNAEHLGQNLLSVFVTERMLPPCEGSNRVDLKSPLTKNKAPTFSTLYAMKKVTAVKQTAVKADRNVLQRLLTASDAGRSIDMEKILQHELMPVPISLAAINGTLNTGNKSLMADVLTQNIVTPPDIQLGDPWKNCLVIDGQALVMALGMPQEVVTFGDFADLFVKTVLLMGSRSSRIDVTFDRYEIVSIKSGTRKKRSEGTRSIRRVIENRSVPVPSNWQNFMSSGENKSDLEHFLSNEILLNAPTHKVIVVSGGFPNKTDAKSSDETMDTTLLQANHEEADTRLVLHCLHANVESVVVASRDTDVLALLVAHFDDMPCTKLWMKAGTSKKQKYIPVHEIRLILTHDQVVSLLAFHAITGCDSVSQIAGHTKKTAWMVFKTDYNLLNGLGENPLTTDSCKNAEKFICKLYNLQNDINTCDQARVKLFSKGRPQESLPPTSDAVYLHIKRAHYQTTVWKQANQPIQELPRATDMGWTMINGILIPQLMTLPPIPEACKEIVSCGCKKGCSTLRCSCRKAKLPCTAACSCADDAQTQCENTKQ